MEVLFDFEIFNTPKQFIDSDNVFYAVTRQFFIDKYKAIADELDGCQKNDEVALVVIHIFSNKFKTVFYNIPEHLADNVNACVTQKDFDELQDKLIEIVRHNNS